MVHLCARMSAVQGPVTGTPEPSSLLMIGPAAIGLAWHYRRRQRAAGNHRRENIGAA
jgi:hypothetical protein